MMNNELRNQSNQDSISTTTDKHESDPDADDHTGTDSLMGSSGTTSGILLDDVASRLSSEASSTEVPSLKGRPSAGSPLASSSANTVKPNTTGRKSTGLGKEATTQAAPGDDGDDDDDDEHINNDEEESQRLERKRATERHRRGRLRESFEKLLGMLVRVDPDFRTILKQRVQRQDFARTGVDQQPPDLSPPITKKETSRDEASETNKDSSSDLDDKKPGKKTAAAAARRQSKNIGTDGFQIEDAWVSLFSRYELLELAAESLEKLNPDAKLPPPLPETLAMAAFGAEQYQQPHGSLLLQQELQQNIPQQHPLHGVSHQQQPKIGSVTATAPNPVGRMPSQLLDMLLPGRPGASRSFSLPSTSLRSRTGLDTASLPSPSGSTTATAGNDIATSILLATQEERQQQQQRQQQHQQQEQRRRRHHQHQQQTQQLRQSGALAFQAKIRAETERQRQINNELERLQLLVQERQVEEQIKRLRQEQERQRQITQHQEQERAEAIVAAALRAIETTSLSSSAAAAATSNMEAASLATNTSISQALAALLPNLSTPSGLRSTGATATRPGVTATAAATPMVPGPSSILPSVNRIGASAPTPSMYDQAVLADLETQLVEQLEQQVSDLVGQPGVSATGATSISDLAASIDIGALCASLLQQHGTSQPTAAVTGMGNGATSFPPNQFGQLSTPQHAMPNRNASHRLPQAMTTPSSATFSLSSSLLPQSTAVARVPPAAQYGHNRTRRASMPTPIATPSAVLSASNMAARSMSTPAHTEAMATGRRKRADKSSEGRQNERNPRQRHR